MFFFFDCFNYKIRMTVMPWSDYNTTYLFILNYFICILAEMVSAPLSPPRFGKSVSVWLFLFGPLTCATSASPPRPPWSKGMFLFRCSCLGGRPLVWRPPPPPPKMIPKWSQSHPKIIPKWSQNNTNMISKWSQNYPKMIPTWSQT